MLLLSGFLCLQQSGSVAVAVGFVASQHVASSQIKDQTRVPCTGRRILKPWTIRKVLQCILVIFPHHSIASLWYGCTMVYVIILIGGCICCLMLQTVIGFKKKKASLVCLVNMFVHVYTSVG